MSTRATIELTNTEKYQGITFHQEVIVESRYAFVVNRLFTSLSQLTNRGSIIEVISIDYAPGNRIPTVNILLPPEIPTNRTSNLFNCIQQQLLYAAKGRLYSKL